MNLDINPSLQEDVFRILDDGETNLYHINCTFQSSSKPGWRYTVANLLELDILQSFLANYTDLITMAFFSTPQEYMELVDASQDLWCEIVFTKTTSYEEVAGDVVLTLLHRAIIKDKKDLTKAYPINMVDQQDPALEVDAQHSNRIHVEVDLIDPVAYDARKRKTSFILRDASMTDAVLTVAKAFDIENVHFIPPDNVTKYTNLVVPPSMGIKEVFSYLQNHDAYGIYDYGLRAYITAGILYLYPLFDVNPDQSVSLHVYSVGEHMYKGFDSYSKVIDNVLHIVSNTGMDDVNLIDEGIENESNWYMCQLTNKIIDAWRTVNEESCTINDDVMEMIVMDTKHSMTAGAYSPVNVATSNTHKLKATMASMHLTATALGWANAIPFAIKPGQLLVLHHDTQDGYKKVKGLPTSLVYSIRRAYDTGPNNVFACSCTINLVTELESQ